MAAGEEHDVDVTKLKIVEVTMTGAVKTGEEEEEMTWTDACRLYRVDDGQLKTRGRGDAKIMARDGKMSRFILREKDVGTLRANHYITADMNLEPHSASDCVYLWTAMDFTDGEIKQETFAIRFKTTEQAERFAAAFSAAMRVAADAGAGGGNAAAGAGAGPAEALVPTLEDLHGIYGEGADAQAARYEQLAARFEEEFGEAPAFFVRAPGRANIIGEHVDYHHYDVFPFALAQDIVIAALPGSAGDDATVEVANTQERFPKGVFRADPSPPVREEGAPLQWWQYVHCGFKGAFDEMPNSPAPCSMKLMVDGKVPPASGLSSSSALVVASVLVTMQAHGVNVPRTKLGTRAWACEHYIGTMGGAMDQMISACAEVGSAAVIKFQPTPSAEPVKLPEGVAFVIANSLDESPKAETANQRYNRRVTEGKLAAKLVAKKAGVAAWKSIRTLRALQDALGAENPSAVVEALEANLKAEPYSEAEMLEEFGEPLADVVSAEEDHMQPKLLENLAAAGGNAEFSLLASARHVLTEAARQQQFVDLCRSGGASIEELGAIMDASHASCRDDYRCSTPALDEITRLAKEAGAAGARLTGAGWGGCAVILCTPDQASEVVQRLQAEFYAGKEDRFADINDAVFTTSPCAGAAVYMTDDQAEV